MTLTLGPLERSHLPQLQRWRNSPALQAHVRHPGLVSMADQEAWYARVRVDPNTRMWAVLGGSSLTTQWPASHQLFPAIVGAAGLCHIDWPNRSAELSAYVMRPDDTEDFAAEVEAVQLLCAEAFDGLGLHRIWAECLTEERRAVFGEALGNAFPVGRVPKTIHRDGQWLNSTFFSLLEDEWRNSRGIAARPSTSSSRFPSAPPGCSS